MNKDMRQSIYEQLAKDHPNPKTELNYESIFQLLIAVLLSAQATDKSVNLVTTHLFEKAPDAQSMALLSEREISEYIKTIGLFRSKAKHVLATSKILLDQYQGEVPKTREQLQALPGVGRKTANVVLNEGFGMPTIAVDTHIFRVCNRTGLAKGKSPDAVEASLEKWTPATHKVPIHHRLILHGRYICIARKPKCKICSLLRWCEYKEKIMV